MSWKTFEFSPLILHVKSRVYVRKKRAPFSEQKRWRQRVLFCLVEKYCAILRQEFGSEMRERELQAEGRGFHDPLGRHHSARENPSLPTACLCHQMLAKNVKQRYCHPSEYYVTSGRFSFRRPPLYFLWGTNRLESVWNSRRFHPCRADECS